MHCCILSSLKKDYGLWGNVPIIVVTNLSLIPVPGNTQVYDAFARNPAFSGSEKTIPWELKKVSMI